MADATHFEGSGTDASSDRSNDVLARYLEEHLERIRFQVDVRMKGELSRWIGSDDLAQDLIVEAMTRASSFKDQGEARFLRWVKTIARRLVCRAARARKGEPPTLSICNDGAGEHEVRLSRIPGQARTPSSIVSGEERYRQTCELLASLSERDFAVIRIVWLENRSLNEAAAELRCSAEAAGKRLSRAMFRLSSRLTSGIRDHVR